MEGVASSATSVLIGYIAGGTEKIRVGSGDYASKPFFTRHCRTIWNTGDFVSRRIDLGLGRAPGTDQLTARALRRNLHNGEDFPEQLEELRQYFKPTGQVKTCKSRSGRRIGYTNLASWFKWF